MPNLPTMALMECSFGPSLPYYSCTLTNLSTFFFAPIIIRGIYIKQSKLILLFFFIFP